MLQHTIGSNTGWREAGAEVGRRGAVPGPWVLGMGLARSRGRARVGLASVVVSRRVNGPNPGNLCRVTKRVTSRIGKGDRAYR